MFKPFSVFVGMRYSLTRKRNFLLSFVSLISMMGVSLGVLVLIVALSVMNGSIAKLRDEALKSVPHVVLASTAIEDNPEAFVERAEDEPRVIAAAPFIEGEASLRYQGETSFIRLRGVDPKRESLVIDNQNPLFDRLMTTLGETENGIILGTRLASRLGIYSSGEVSATALGSLLSRSLSDSQGFEVVGFADFGIYSNANIALINIAQAQTLFANDNSVTTKLRLRVSDIFAAEVVARDVFAADPDVNILPWNEAQASLFNALAMEKILTSFMLLMIVMIGAVNIVSTLVMVVSDKGADIAILRTMGASRGAIMTVFIVQGLIAGLIGTVVGAILGVALAYNIADISLLIERAINSVFTDANVFLISHLQTQVNAVEVMWICVIALGISLIATLYPAYRASKIQPAEVLRYE